jgi:hypothetical protein
VCFHVFACVHVRLSCILACMRVRVTRTSLCDCTRSDHFVNHTLTVERLKPHVMVKVDTAAIRLNNKLPIFPYSTYNGSATVSDVCCPSVAKIWVEACASDAGLQPQHYMDYFEPHINCVHKATAKSSDTSRRHVQCSDRGLDIVPKRLAVFF